MGDAYQRVAPVTKTNQTPIESSVLRGESAGLLAAVVESSDDAIIAKSLDGEIVSCNPAAERLYGYRAEELIGKSIELLVPPGSSEMVDILRRIRDGERVEQFQTVRLRKNRTAVRVSLTVSPIRDRAGVIVGVSSVAHDVTELLRAQEQLRESAEYTRSLIEASLDPFVTIDAEGRITDVNEATAKATGVAREQLIGTDFSDYFTEPEKAREGMKRAFEQGAVTDYPLTIRDGKLHDVLYNASVFRDSTGRVRGVVAAARDVTALYQVEEELRRLNDELEHRVRLRTAELERLNRNLKSFVYTMAHDLRQPLRGMTGFATVLATQYSDVLDEAGRDYAQRITKAATRMAALIDDLLELSRGSITTELRRETVDLSAMTRELIAELRQRDPDRAAEFQVEDGITTSVDRPMLRAVLRNLLENAWKFTAGRERTRIEFAALADETGENGFSVRDNGVGFDPAYAGKLFEPFQSLHSPAEYPGSGIGLASVRQTVEAHGGRIWAEAAADKGAVFYVALPADRTNATRTALTEQLAESL